MHVPRESRGDISNEFEMDYNEEMSREGNGKPRKKFKQSMENDQGMLPMSLKKKVLNLHILFFPTSLINLHVYLSLE